MSNFKSLLPLISLLPGLLSAAPVTQKEFTYEEIPPTTELVWYPCSSSLGLAGFFCANLDVPLDWQEPNNGLRAVLPILKLAALENSTDGHYKGMMIVNPGGPAESGVTFVNQSAEYLVANIGTNYDILSFDPRGVGFSIPSGGCLDDYDEATADALVASTPKLTRRTDSLGVPTLFDIMGNVFSRIDTATARCNKLVGGKNNAVPYMTSTAGARDTLAVVDAFSCTPQGRGQILLNYWGISYGSLLGMIFSSMYPERVGRFVLDGIVDPIDTLAGTHLKNTIHTDAAVNTFFDVCFAGGSKNCSFFTGKSPKDIEDRLQGILNALTPRKAQEAHWANATALNYGLFFLKLALWQGSENPLEAFAGVSELLLGYEQLVLAGNITIPNLILAGIEPDLEGLAISLIPVIQMSCADSDVPLFTPVEESYISEMLAQSSLVGDLVSGFRLACSRWPIAGKWKYTGPYGGKPKNSILWVGNTIDPNTPIENGQKWHKAYAGSKFLTIEGTGHTSQAVQNTCAYKHIKQQLQGDEAQTTYSFCSQKYGPLAFA